MFLQEGNCLFPHPAGGRPRSHPRRPHRLPLAKPLLLHNQHPLCCNPITKRTQYGDTPLLLASRLFHNHNPLFVLSPLLSPFPFIVSLLQDEQTQLRAAGAGGSGRSSQCSGGASRLAPNLSCSPRKPQDCNQLAPGPAGQLAVPQHGDCPASRHLHPPKAVKILHPCRSFFRHVSAYTLAWLTGPTDRLGFAGSFRTSFETSASLFF